ncbi:hypothetical protein [Rhizobium rhizogenes]|uniref:hypothetical protein n=1 Tax=Rhizobium rhizogenes TaxID=359 RepID=UPI001F2670F7|nr:hypothetical protein [Rhizobium rhizogenes]WEO70146.1 hypothetical protein G6L54_034485 [Rhizobium rhizogenes]
MERTETRSFSLSSGKLQNYAVCKRRLTPPTMIAGDKKSKVGILVFYRRKCMIGRAVITLCLLSTSAVAADYKPYQNSRFGYSIDLPSEFKVVSVADNNDGMKLVSLSGSAMLLVWGNQIMQGGFKAESDYRRKSYSDEGWQISYEKHATAWASYSGVRDGRILYVREIALCDDAMGNFSLEYPQVDQKRYGAIVERLVKSLAAPRHCE